MNLHMMSHNEGISAFRMWCVCESLRAFYQLLWMKKWVLEKDVEKLEEGEEKKSQPKATPVG